MANYLKSIGVAAEHLILETKSRNTYENALYSAKILEKKHPNKKVLISTSSTHMKRALACFNKQNLNCTPFSVDQKNKFLEFKVTDTFLPDAEILNKWYWLIHEFVGIVFYKIQGYC